MKTVYLLGSGKPHGQSTSESLARYLDARLGKESPFCAFDAKKVLHAGEAERFLTGLDEAELFVLATPLYIDSLPYPVIHALQAIVARRDVRAPRCRFVAIVNSGFPEASQSRLALRMCAVFAREAHLDWAGGLALGGGEAVRGQRLEKAGGVAAKARRSLELAAEALRKGDPIPERAVALMASPVIPHFLYRWLGAWGWRRRARALGTTIPLNARPFAR